MMYGDETLSTTHMSTNSLNQNVDLQNQQPVQFIPQNTYMLMELLRIKPESDNIITIINNLNTFYFKLKTLQNVEIILITDVLYILQRLAESDNIKINLSLYKIYLKILSKQSLYHNYLALNNNYKNILDKISFLLYLIDECILLIENLRGLVYDKDLFMLKNRTIELIQYIYFNFGNKITEEYKLNKLKNFITDLPSHFFSAPYLELNKNKDLLTIFNTLDLNKVTNFENKFLDINNYFEQYEIFKKFVQYNSGDIEPTNNKVNKENENKEINIINNEPNSTFVLNYGLLLLKFCKYHHYIFLNKEESPEEMDDLKNDNENSRVVFLLDRFKQVLPHPQNQYLGNPNNAVHQNQSLNYPINQSVSDILQDKQFLSVIDSDEYRELIKKQITYFLNNTKAFDNNSKIKNIRDQMIYYIDTLEKNSYVPLYLKNFKYISMSDNFTPAFSTNVPAGKSNKLYIETNPNEQILVFVEFFLEDKTKDITFEVNKYDILTNSFKQIYHEEKVEELFKFFVLCNGYSLYEIVFNNEYSWFNSKDINYRISILKNLPLNIEIPKALKENEFSVNINGKNYIYNNEIILKRMKDKEEERFINVNVILYNNNLRIVTLDKDENNKDQITFKEIVEKEEKYIPKYLFDYTLISHLKKLKINPEENKRIIISIFSQNRDIGKLSKTLEEKIKNNKIQEYTEFLQKIGLVPNPILDDYKVEYRLYDLCEQILVYHLFLCKYQKNPFPKNILLLKFDKLVINYAMYSEGVITTNLKQKIDNNNFKTTEEFTLNFINNANKIYGGISLVLSFIDYNDEEKKKQLMELFDKIKKYCVEELEPKVPLVIYKDNAINISAFKYMNLFYN